MPTLYDNISKICVKGAMKLAIILKGIQIYHSGVLARGDFALPFGNTSPDNAANTVDASNFVLLPGFADVHVHLREPGFSYLIRRQSHRARARRRTADILPYAPCPI